MSRAGQRRARDVRDSAERDARLQHLQACLLRAAGRRELSARPHDRVLKVARTIADLADAGAIGAEHLAETLAHRRLDRRLV